MNKKIDESMIMDYLYGNLTEEERQYVEEQMVNDEKLKSEIEALAKVKEFMGKSEDKEVIAPSFVFEEKVESGISYFESQAFRWVSSIAASVLILLFSAYITGFNVSSTSSGLAIGFGQLADDNTMTKEEITGILENVLTDYDSKRITELTQLESKLTDRIQDSKNANLTELKEYMTSNSSESQNMMRQYLAQSNEKNREMIAEYFKVSSEQQQQYLNTVLTDFSQFYNKQRKQDLEVIRTGILDFKNSNDQKQYETDLVLANLVDMVNTQNK